LEKLKDKYDHLIFETYKIPLDGLAIYRMLFAAASLFLIGYPNVTWLSEIPDFFYRPQLFNIAYFMADQMPSYAILFLLSWLPVILLVLVFFGYKTKYAAIGFGLLLIIQGAFESSLGKIDHGVLHPLTAIIMAFSGWEKFYSFDAAKMRPGINNSGLAVFLLALAIGFAFFTAGAAKFFGGWVDPGQLGVWHHFFGSFYVWERKLFLAPLFIEIDNYYFWKFQDYLIVVFECLFLPALLFKKVFRIVIVLAILFHTGVFLIFNITITSIFLAYAAFLPWKKIHECIKVKELQKNINYIFKLHYFLISLILIPGIYAVFIYFDTKDNLLSLLNILLYPVGIDYRILHTLLTYFISWSILIWIWRLNVNKKHPNLKLILKELK